MPTHDTIFISHQISRSTMQEMVGVAGYIPNGNFEDISVNEAIMEPADLIVSSVTVVPRRDGDFHVMIDLVPRNRPSAREELICYNYTFIAKSNEIDLSVGKGVKYDNPDMWTFPVRL